MMDLAADNARLRKDMRRVIAEREIATAALRSIVTSPKSAETRAMQALDKIMALQREGDK